MAHTSFSTCGAFDSAFFLPAAHPRKPFNPPPQPFNPQFSPFSAKYCCFLTVDTRVLRCYKPEKDKLFGGESPNGLQGAVRE